jgi:hypothetical protein
VGVVIRDMNKRRNNNNFLITRSFQFCAIGKKKMVDNAKSNTPMMYQHALISVLQSHYKLPLLGRRRMSTMSTMIILVRK